MSMLTSMLNCYKITPYRDLKRPAGLKRSSSLRTPRGRRDSGSNDTGGSHTPSRDRQVRRSASVKSAGKERGMSPGPPARVNGHSPRATSAKSPNGSSGRRTPNSSYVHPNEELYPAHVFEKESPDSAWRKGAPKKVIRKPKTKANPPSSDKFYSTVWLSDYESEPDKKLELIGTGGTIALSSRATTPYSSGPTSPLSSQASSPFSSRPNTPSLFSKFEDEDSGLHSEIDKSCDEAIGLRKKLHRTLSLPDAELNQLRAEDLQDRFTTLQLEQENRELKKLTVELQAALEKLEERVNCLQSIEHDSLDEASSLVATHPQRSEIYLDSKVSVENYHYDRKISHSNELPQTLRKRSKSDADLLLKRKNKHKDTTTCCSIVCDLEPLRTGRIMNGTGKDPKKIKRERISVHGFYRIGKVIGDGNFAVVRECKSRKTNKEYALKIISKAKVKGKEHMVENEISILRRVKHKNIVELIEEYETPKEIFLVMELVKGGDLFEAIVKATKYTEKDASHMVRDLASALHYLHSMNVVHRDIKPENLLVVNYSDNRKSLKIADFGLATEVKSPMFLVCGTPTYVAPEILDETGYGLKVDIWAAGVITYILLCGFPPFRSLDQDELFDLILAGEFEYLSPFWDDISDSAKDLINHMLVVDDNKRFSALQVLNHSWIKGHTTGDKDIHSNLKTEITRNFDPRRRLRGAAIAVQTVNYFSKKTQSNSKKRSFQTDNQRLIESKKVVFSDEVLNLPSQPSTAHKLHHGSEGRLHFYENAWQNIESLTGGDLPYRHVSSPDIHSPVNKSQLEISDLVLNAMSEESVLPQQAKHGFGWSDNRQKPVSKTKHSPSLQDDSLSLHSDQNLHDSCEDNGVRQRKRSHSARVEHKDGTPIEKFGIPQITKTGSVNLWQFVERDLVLKPALIDENVVAPKGDSANHSPGSVSAEQTQDSSETKISDHSQKKNTGLVNLTEELKRLKMSLSEGANVAVEKGRENPRNKGPQKDHAGRKALSPLSRNIIRKDFHKATDSLNTILDEPEQLKSVKINTPQKRPSVRTPANYVPVWKRPLGQGKSPGGSPTPQSPQRKAKNGTVGNLPAARGKCKVLRQPPMKFRSQAPKEMFKIMKVNALEKLSKSLQDGKKLAVGESYQELSAAVRENHTVQHRYPDKRSSHAKQRPKSLNFEIFFSEQEEINRTDDEKIESYNGDFIKDKAGFPFHAESPNLSQEEEKELLNHEVGKSERDQKAVL
ncbi:Serine/threonine-protein kinase DCLK1 [Stylophora pistillata]|uniref:Serine/threonine-protein kinase DCLK1 n=1 Tax=Stylophora pistillata TaxID=50429 RepID=A0A2B4RRF8_STYPI|nr:Serine/threonine-protein kinase DCLK1 [Stylophora pistillata]